MARINKYAIIPFKIEINPLICYDSVEYENIYRSKLIVLEISFLYGSYSGFKSFETKKVA